MAVTCLSISGRYQLSITAQRAAIPDYRDFFEMLLENIRKIENY